MRLGRLYWRRLCCHLWLSHRSNCFWNHCLLNGHGIAIWIELCRCPVGLCLCKLTEFPYDWRSASRREKRGDFRVDCCRYIGRKFANDGGIGNWGYRYWYFGLNGNLLANRDCSRLRYDINERTIQAAFEENYCILYRLLPVEI